MPLYETFKSPFSGKVHIPQNVFHFLAANVFLIPAQMPLGEKMAGKLLTTKWSNGLCPDGDWNTDAVRRLLERLNVSRATWGLAPSSHNSFQERDKGVQNSAVRAFPKSGGKREGSTAAEVLFLITSNKPIAIKTFKTNLGWDLLIYSTRLV